MMIAYTGLDGSGKTYHMAEAAQAAIKKGIDVFATTPFKGARLLENERQLIRIENGHIFFDEWHQDHDAKEWWSLDPVLRHIVTQHRKYNLVIHWSAQHFFFMDSFIRRETAFVWDHEALFRDANTGRSRICFRLPIIGEIKGLHRAYKYPALEIELKHRKPKILAKKTFFVRPSIYNTYDSYKKIALTSKQISDDELVKIKDPYNAPKILDVKAVKSKVIHKRKADILANAGAGSADQIVYENPEFEDQKASFNRYEKSQDDIKLRHGKENPHELRPSMKIADP